MNMVSKRKETEAEEGKRRVNIFSRFHVAATRSDGTEESVPLLMELLRREFETRNAYCGVRFSKKSVDTNFGRVQPIEAFRFTARDHPT